MYAGSAPVNLLDADGMKVTRKDAICTGFATAGAIGGTALGEVAAGPIGAFAGGLLGGAVGGLTCAALLD